MGFRHGETILRREVWRGHAYMHMPVRVVEDSGETLAVYLAPGTPFTFVDGNWPWDGTHPWLGRRWEGHGVLQLMRAGDPAAIWVFWEGSQRRHAAWYVNLQEPFRRVDGGVDTFDLELDYVVAPDGSWRRKDDEKLDAWVARGRWTAAEVAEIRAVGARVERELAAGRRWWDGRWAEWAPPPGWDP